MASEGAADRSRAEVLRTTTPEAFAAAVVRATDRLRAGELVALPTETVYGLAANALDAEAVGRIFEVKERPRRNPVIVHVASGEMARRCVTAWPAAAERLAAAFWPGPLTLVLPRSREVPDVVVAGGETVGIRWPAHPFMQAVIRHCGFPLAAPSANRANEISPTTAAHVEAGLGDRIPLIIDGGPAQVGIESTVVDLVARPIRVLRPGMIDEVSLAGALAAEAEWGAGGRGNEGGGSAEALRSPGQLERHYSPRARLVVLGWRDEDDLRRRLEGLGVGRDGTHVLTYHRIPSADVAARVCVIPHDPEAYARAMYAEWHVCDRLGARTIVVEAVPEGATWRGIADRLRRASSPAAG